VRWTLALWECPRQGVVLMGCWVHLDQFQEEAPDFFDPDAWHYEAGVLRGEVTVQLNSERAGYYTKIAAYGAWWRLAPSTPRSPCPRAIPPLTLPEGNTEPFGWLPDDQPVDRRNYFLAPPRGAHAVGTTTLVSGGDPSATQMLQSSPGGDSLSCPSNQRTAASLPPEQGQSRMNTTSSTTPSTSPRPPQ
jgi:hypothetical protein